MATYLDRVQTRHRRRIQRRFDADHKRLALLISMILLRFARLDAVTRKRVIPTDGRVRLIIKATIWTEVLKPYYTGNSDEPFNGPAPQSRFAQLVYDGIEGATRIQVQRQVSLLKRFVKDSVILAWLTTLLFSQRQQPSLPEVKIPKRLQEPFYAWVDSNGYKLNDRIQRNAIDVRTKIDRMIDHHIAAGTDVAVIGTMLDNFITISGRSTGHAYGEYGAYAPWLLVRGAMLLAAGTTTIITSALNPYVEYVQWRLSPSHKKSDDCDDNARGGRDGDGVYLVGNTPRYPNHPNCTCSLVPIGTLDVSAVTMQLRHDIQAGNANAQRLRGVLNVDRIVGALMSEGVKKST